MERRQRFCGFKKFLESFQIVSSQPNKFTDGEKEEAFYGRKLRNFP